MLHLSDKNKQSTQLGLNPSIAIKNSTRTHATLHHTHYSTNMIQVLWNCKAVMYFLVIDSDTQYN